MICELIEALRTECAPGARALGLAYEAAAIHARYRRVGTSWAVHLEACRSAILAGAERCRTHRRALVIGAGACLDVPVAELAERFSEVILADVAVSPSARGWQRRSRGRVKAVAWDATGALARLAAGRKTATSAEVWRIIGDAEPGEPPCGDADLVVSANCLSQLGLIPVDRMAAADEDEDLPARCAAQAAQRHLAWLAKRGGVRVLISDVFRLDVADDGRELARTAVFPQLPLREPDRRWCWDIAPIPEWSRDHHRVHEVGAWVDAD